MKKLLALTAFLLATPAIAADNIAVTSGSGPPVRSTDTSVGAVGTGPYVNWFAPSTPGAAGTAPVALGGAMGTPNPQGLTVQGNASGVPMPISGAVTQSGTWTVQQGTPPWPISVADGVDVTQGAKADTVCGTDTGTCSVVALIKRNNQIADGPLQAQVSASAVHVGDVGLAAQAYGGCTGQVILTAASNNATQIKGSSGTLCWVRWENTTTSIFSIRFYDTATAPAAGAPCNATTNVVTNDVAQSNATSPGGVANLGPYGQAFAGGIVVCITGANANNDNTNAVTGLNLNIGWK
jgi:hypothetical protein